MGVRRALLSRWWLSPLDNPPAVNGLHHPTGVYDNRSKNHLLSHKFAAAKCPARAHPAARSGPSWCDSTTHNCIIISNPPCQARAIADSAEFLPRSHLQRVLHRCQGSQKMRKSLMSPSIGLTTIRLKPQCFLEKPEPLFLTLWHPPNNPLLRDENRQSRIKFLHFFDMCFDPAIGFHAK